MNFPITILFLFEICPQDRRTMCCKSHIYPSLHFKYPWAPLTQALLHGQQAFLATMTSHIIFNQF